MFIKNVSMKNFGNVKEEKLVFDKGLTLFSGNNGQGKSTVLKCLALLLFNQTNGKLSDYIRWGTEGFSISTEFLHLGRSIRVSFDYTEKSSNRIATDLDTGEEYINSVAITFLDELLDFNRAKASIISFENEIDLITTSPSERREYLKKIYDLNFKEELQVIAIDNQNAKDSIKTLEGEYSSLESQTFEMMVLERLPFTEEHYKQLEIMLDLSRSTLYGFEADKTRYEEDVIRLNSLKRKEVLTRNSLHSKEDSFAHLEEEILNLEKSEKEMKLDLSEIEAERINKESELWTKIENLGTEIKSVGEQFSVVKELAQQYEKESDAIPSRKEAIKNSEREYYGLIHKKESIENHIKIFETGFCPTCNHKVDPSIIDSNKVELEKINSSIVTLEQNLSSSKETLSDIESDIEKNSREYSRLEREHYRLTNEKILSEKEISSLQESFELKKKNLAESFEYQKILLAQKVKNYESQKETVILEIQSLKIDLEEVAKEIESMGDLGDSGKIDADISKTKESIDSFEKEMKSYSTIIISNEEKRNINRIQEEKKRERDNKLVVLRDKIESNKVEVAKTDAAMKILSKDFPSFVISKMVQSLSFYINEFLSKVYPHYEIEVVENKSSLRVLYGPEKSDVKLASGFEQQVFSFAWKYALGKIQNYGLLILDEVDSAASEENSGKFYETLAKMESYFEQVFIVTHKQDIRDLLANDYQASVYQVTEGVYEKVV